MIPVEAKFSGSWPFCVLEIRYDRFTIVLDTTQEIVESMYRCGVGFNHWQLIGRLVERRRVDPKP